MNATVEAFAHTLPLFKWWGKYFIKFHNATKAFYKCKHNNVKTSNIVLLTI